MLGFSNGETPPKIKKGQEGIAGQAGEGYRGLEGSGFRTLGLGVEASMSLL